jgi:molybdenum cofactor cytidylyltransferase
MGNISVILLAAGNSGRMGRPKPLLTWPDGITFAERLVLDFRAAGFVPVILVVNRDVFGLLPDLRDTLRVINEHPDLGRFQSLLLGIKEVPPGSPVFIHNIDNPFLEAGLLKRMELEMNTEGFVVPVFQGCRGHPVLMGGGMVDKIRGMDPDSDFREVIKKFEGREVEGDHPGIHWNINTPEDYDRFRRDCPDRFSGSTP